MNVNLSIESAHVSYGSSMLEAAPISSKNPSLLAAIQSLVEKIFETFKFFIEPIKQAIVIKQIFQIVNLPFIVNSIVKKCVFFHEMTYEKKIDSVLGICNYLREICETTAAFIVGLEKMDRIPVISAPWIKYFSYVMSFLSITSIASKILICSRVTKLGELLEQAEEIGKIDGHVTMKSYQAMLRVIEECRTKDKDFVQEMFNVNEDKLGDALIDLEFKARRSEGEEEQKLIENAIYGLKARVRQNLVSSALSITAAAANLVGTALLLVVPFTPIFWAVLGVGIAADISRFLSHKLGEYMFAQAVDLKRTNWEWLTC